jgi:hypothetical protein
MKRGNMKRETYLVFVFQYEQRWRLLAAAWWPRAFAGMQTKANVHQRAGAPGESFGATAQTANFARG